MYFDEQKIFAYIDGHKQEYIDLLARMCNQKSLAMTGEGVDEMFAIVQDILKEHDLDVTVCPTPGNTCLIASRKGRSDKTIGFYHHYDVMPAEPLEEWNSDPWHLTIKDGTMYARGVSDNKGGFASSLCAVDAYLKVYGELPCSVKFLIEGEEEVGSPNLPYFTEKYRDQMDCDGIIFEGGDRNSMDSPIEIVAGVKGLLYLELTARGGKSDAHSMMAAIAPNPAWHLVHALSTLKDEDGNILVDGFFDDIKPIGQAELDVLKNDAFEEENTKEFLGIKAFNGGKTGIELLKDYHYAPTLNIAGLVSGYTAEGSKTVLPAKAVAKIDIRLVPDMDPYKITELVKAHLAKHGFGDIEVEMLSAMKGFRSDPNSEFIKVVTRSAKKFTGLDPQISLQHPGTMPLALFCSEKNIPATAVGCGTPRNGAHGPNEMYRIADFVEDIKFRSVMMHELGGGQ